MDEFQIVYQTIDIIEKDLIGLTSVSTISSKMGYSSNYLNRLFKNIFRFTVLDYLKMRKITEGLNKFNNFNNIIDIAFEYNFNSHEVFIRNCKKYFNSSPGELLKSSKWIGLKRINREIIWFFFNKDLISIKSVKLPDLVLEKNDRGNIKIESLDFVGNMSELKWDPQYNYKLIPNGIYRCLTILKPEVTNPVKDYINYISPNSTNIIEFTYENRSIYYFK